MQVNLKKESKTLCHYHQWDGAEDANRAVKLGVSERTPATGSVPTLPSAYHAQNECPGEPLRSARISGHL